MVFVQKPAKLKAAIANVHEAKRSRLSVAVPGHKVEDQICNLVSLFVQREMPSVKQVDFRIRNITPEGFRARRNEGGILPAPGHEGRRLVVTKPGLPFRVGRDVGPVVVEQVRLNLALTGLRQISISPSRYPDRSGPDGMCRRGGAPWLP